MLLFSSLSCLSVFLLFCCALFFFTMSGRDSRADRSYADDDGSGSGGGGRYSRALQRRRSSTSHERDPPANENDDDDFLANYSRSSHRPHQRPRFEGGYNNGGNTYNDVWQQQEQQVFMGGDLSNRGNAFGMPPNMNFGNGYPYYNFMQQQQQQQPFMSNDYSGGAMPFGMPRFNPNMNTNSNNGMDPASLLQFLLQQQQQQQQQSGSSGHPSPLPDPFQNNNNNNNNSTYSGDTEDAKEPRTANSAPAASRVLPSVDEFVPVVPKSLLNLVRGGPSSASPLPEGGGNAAVGDAAGDASHPAPGAGGALVLLEAPKIAPEMDKRAREQRRAHISGFPNETTREELENYFRLLLPEVRRLQTEREIRQLAEETGLIQRYGEEGVRHIPANANLSNIDELRDLTLNQGKTKPFSFIELRLADMLDELIQQCQADPQRFLFTPAHGAGAFPLMIRRPRDTEPLTGVEESKVVLIGFPLTIPTTVIKSLFEASGKLLAFEMHNGYAYGEFSELRDAKEFRADVHGQVVGNSVVVALPLYDWLKALLVREGVDIAIADDDPMSGNYVMKQVRERMPDTGASNGQEGGGGGGGSGSNALVLAEDPAAASLQIMRELLDMSFSLPDMLVRFAGLYPHLRPLYANTQVTVYPTPVLVLLNLFDEEELVHDVTYSRLLADIEEEVEKHGRVRRLIVPRREARPKLPEAPKPGVDFDETDEAARNAAMAAYDAAKKNFGAVIGRYMSRQTHPVWGGYGRVFIEYETVDEAAEAQQQIAGKLFGERTVITSFLYPDLLKEEGEEEEVEAEEKEEDKDNGSDAADAPEGEGDHQRDAAVDEEGTPSDVGGKDAKDDDDDHSDVASVPASVHAEDID